ncbi:MAG: 50S ribosomal protein L23 [Thermoplasmatota archaeon]
MTAEPAPKSAPPAPKAKAPKAPAAKAPANAPTAPAKAPKAPATAPKAPVKAAKAAKPAKKATGKAPKAAQPTTPTGVDPHAVLLHPIVTEKTMMLMDSNNSLEFLVRRTANRTMVKAAVERLFDCQVAHVNTRITKDGKRAVVKFAGETTAEDIGMRIGVF